MRRALAVGLIGAGRMGRVHADVLTREVAAGRLVAVADPDESASRSVGEATGATPYRDHVELLSDAGVDAVIVAATTRAHVEIVEAAAAAGVHVFCEKPLALDVAEALAAASAAEQAGVRLQVGLYRRFDADYLRARERIRSGAIGHPQFVRSLQYDTFVPPPAFCDPAVSGGIAVDMGIHEFDIAAWLLDDDIVEVHAFGAVHVSPELGAVGDVDTMVVSFRFASGALGSVELVRDVGYAEDVRTEVVGTRGSVVVGIPSSSSAHAAAGVLGVDLDASVFARFRPALAAQLRSFCGAILEGRAVEVDGRQSIPGLAVGIAARESSRIGRAVALQA